MSPSSPGAYEMVCPVDGRVFVEREHPLTATPIVELPSLTAPTQSGGTTTVLKAKRPRLSDVVTSAPSQEIGANWTA